ncbi:thiopurine S-methyltransferase [Flavobacterium sp. L1I52]|uniref:Thiopurine S-methyltransferase n=1 Tax=Flavobacterium pokkalii TaxID=1940408 RepID=A0ABR7UTG8_9FLAO|nr:methyltransferase domain-containing protein [Flavobacterium pokkalii]MBD0725318.1 thiopurine S-methyltransferase [Flavobacterium pokkalii]
MIANKEQCCTVSCESPLDQNYWDAQYKSKATGWDLGEIAPPIKNFIDSLENKNSRILIPGCGNTYEAIYLLAKGFTNITIIDIAPTLVALLQEKFANNANIKIILGDFFEHKGEYDVIIEQTFFCALPPFMRQKYVWKMHQLLARNGILAGLLFNRDFDVNPPFGGNQKEYEMLFKAGFHFEKLEVALDSAAPRKDTELFFEFQKNNAVTVQLYTFEGITCSGCMENVLYKIAALSGVLNVSMSTNFEEILIVSQEEIPLQQLQKIVSHDEKYKIQPIKA